MTIIDLETKIDNHALQIAKRIIFTIILGVLLLNVENVVILLDISLIAPIGLLAILLITNWVDMISKVEDYRALVHMRDEFIRKKISYN